MHWRHRLRDAQNEISQKTIDAIQAIAAKKYAEMAEKTIIDFENIYNRALLAASKENRKPAPRDLYSLNDYWTIHTTFKADCQKFGDELLPILFKGFGRVYIDIYKGLSVGEENDIYCLNKKEIIRAINRTWSLDKLSWKGCFWRTMSYLWDGLTGALMQCLITNKKPKELKKRLQQQFDTNLKKLNTLIVSEATFVQIQAAALSYRDSKTRFSNTLSFTNAYIKKFGEEEDVIMASAIDILAEATPEITQKYFPNDSYVCKRGGT
jgi:hypothetical protein